MRIYRKREAQGEGFVRPAGMPEPLYRLLVARGISSAEEARAFLRPSASMLHAPSLLKGIDEAVALLRAAIESHQRICVYGDYDVDGVSASAIMVKTLRRMGGSAEAYLPSRHDEGYGLNEPAVRAIAEEYALLLTVDCGITSVSLVSLARELGLTVIVTDHHRPAEEIPDCVIVNPLIGDYPAPALCGAGVAFKLSEALLGREAALDYVDIAALATVADIVPLTGENRVIVKLGLDSMNKNPRIGLALLREVAGLHEKPFTAGMLGFQIGPRLNASGRVGSARRAFELLTTENPDRARALAIELNEENTLRRKLEEDIVAEAQKQLEGFDFIRRRAIVLAGDGWNSGVIGLAASRLVERYHFPTILISLNGDTGVGSCRSIPAVDIHAALTAVSGHLVRFGGHRQAAGLTIRRDAIEAFSEALDAQLAETVDPFGYIPISEYDLDAQFEELDAVFVTLMESFAPTGMGNPAPVFRSRANVVEARRVGREGAHLSLRLNDGTNTLRAIAFREGRLAEKLVGETDVLYAPVINEFGGRTSVQLDIKSIASAAGTELIARAAASEADLLAVFLTEVIYNKTYSSDIANRISEAELMQMLNASPQGTLIIAASAASASGFETLDTYIGEYPDDPRAFNALCVLPAGAPPKTYRNILYAGMPAPEGSFELACPPAAWLKSLPGIDELRRAYVALKRMLARPVRCTSLASYAKALTDECALDITCLVASILVLIDMGLIVQEGDGKLSLGAVKKADPMDAPAFRAVTALKEGGVAREQC